MKGNKITVTYYDRSGEVSEIENYSIEKVYSFGFFTLKEEINSEDTDYRRVCGSINSDDYDDAVVPEWFEEEWW